MVQFLFHNGVKMRKNYIQSQKELNRKVLAVLPIFYPKEILTAMNILAVEVWGPPGEPFSPEVGRIQTYVCPIVRNAFAFLVGGGCSEVDGVLFPHTCDSIQGLSGLVADFTSWDKPVINFIHPKGQYRESTAKYLKKEFADLAKSLETITGNPLEIEELKKAIALHQEIEALQRNIIEKRAYINLSDMEFFQIYRKGEYLWPEDYLSELKSLAEKIEPEKVQNGIPVIVSGIVPEPMSIYENLAEAGAYVVADDFAAIGRRLVTSEEIENDPFETILKRYFSVAPCSTRSSDMNLRRDYLLELSQKTGAKGLIILNVKFCEPEMFDAPMIRQHLQDKGLSVLYLESELERELSGQTVTRIEAFVEMASNGGSK